MIILLKISYVGIFFLAEHENALFFLSGSTFMNHANKWGE